MEPDSQTQPSQSRKEAGGCNLIANLSKSITFSILSAGLSGLGQGNVR